MIVFCMSQTVSLVRMLILPWLCQFILNTPPWTRFHNWIGDSVHSWAEHSRRRRHILLHSRSAANSSLIYYARFSLLPLPARLATYRAGAWPGGCPILVQWIMSWIDLIFAVSWHFAVARCRQTNKQKPQNTIEVDIVIIINSSTRQTVSGIGPHHLVRYQIW